MIERRRSPRTLLSSAAAIRLEMRHRIRLLDISHSGALMVTEAMLPIGTRGYLRTDLAAMSFQAQVAVRRHGPDAAPPEAATVGTEFISMDERSRMHLERFLQRGKE